MVQKTQYQLSQRAHNAINTALQKRIPHYQEFRIDNNPNYLSQVDLFGNVDTLITLGGTGVYKNQNKSRDDRHDICIECRSYRCKTINPDTHAPIPIAGAYYYETAKCWLTPRWGDLDTFTVALPSVGFVGSFNRFYLEILFSKSKTWETMTGIHKEGNDTDTYIVFFDYKTFCRLYLQTVADVMCGDHYATILELQNLPNTNSIE